MYQLDSVNWLSHGVVVVLVVLVLHATLPLLAGLVCGWLMKDLTIRGGLAMGAVVAGVAVLWGVFGIAFPGGFINTCIELGLPVIATWLQCRWQARRKQRRGQIVG